MSNLACPVSWPNKLGSRMFCLLRKPDVSEQFYTFDLLQGVEQERWCFIFYFHCYFTWSSTIHVKIFHILLTNLQKCFEKYVRYKELKIWNTTFFIQHPLWGRGHKSIMFWMLTYKTQSCNLLICTGCNLVQK